MLIENIWAEILSQTQNVDEQKCTPIVAHLEYY